MADAINPGIAKKTGLPPGTLVFAGEQKMEQPEFSVLTYSKTECALTELSAISEIEEYRNREGQLWINYCGLHDTEMLGEIGDMFQLDPLTMEDIVSTHQRPKVDVYENYTLIICRMLSLSDSDIVSEQISIVLMDNVVITFQEIKGDVFAPIRQRLNSPKSRLRRFRTDYLAYALIDVIVDNYFVILEKFGEEIVDIEENVLESAEPELLERIYFQRRKLTYMRRSVWPLREAVNMLRRDEIKQLKKTTYPFLADLSDHIAQVLDIIENSREMVSSLLDIYLSMQSHRMNEVMKVLTIMATIFIPLSFLAGVYGMNFDTSASPLNLPELSLPYGYITFWLACLGIGGGLLAYFKRIGWL